MKQFILRSLKFSLIGLILIIIIIINYIWLDPFKVLYNYSNFSYLPVVPNRDYISTEIFKRNKSIFKYNSFIFGSSRTLAFSISTWKKHLSEKDSPFMFDASKESVYGIYTKIKYLDSLNWKLDNVLVVLCRDCSFYTSKNDAGHITIHHPDVTKESKFIFHLTFLKAYFSPAFLISYYTFKLTGNYYEWMMKGFIENREIVFTPVTNEQKIIDQEKEIKNSTLKYYLARANMFYDRDKIEKTDSLSRINKKHIFMLKEIERIFRKHNTKYKVIISPLYDQIKMNKQDIKILQSIFKTNVYDFSGKNVFTESRFNYYEISHYRPSVGDSIFSIIYKEQSR
ncbi:MAG: hypothetical protein V1773_13710 [bacterium]